MLNLLPPEIKQQYRFKSRLYSLTLFYIVLVAALGLGAAVLTTYNMLQQSAVSEKQSKISSLQAQRKTKSTLLTKAAFIEDRYKVASQLQDKRQWTDIINRLASATPTGVQLLNVKFTVGKTNDLTVTLKGSTTDRRSIVLFRDKLEEDSHYEKTSIEAITEAGTETQKSFEFSLLSTYNEKVEATQ